MNEIAEILYRSAALIEKGHCLHTLARRADNEPVNCRSQDAVAFCAIGSVYAAADRSGFSAVPARTFLIHFLTGADSVGRRFVNQVFCWSDSTPTAEVVATIKRAAQAAEDSA